MGENGFIRDMLDVKVLVLYVMSLAERPLDVQDIYALCYQDDRLTYFDVCEALPQLVGTEHLCEMENGLLEITDKGRENIAITADSIAFPVRERARAAVERFNKERSRSDRVRTTVVENEHGFGAKMELYDDFGKLISMEITAPNKKQARNLEAAFRRCAERLYAAIMDDLLEEAGE